MSTKVVLHGARHNQYFVNDRPGHTAITVELADGRTVELVVGDNGDVNVTAYVSRPQVTSDKEVLRCDFHVPALTPAIHGQQVFMAELTTGSITLDDVLVPGTPAFEGADPDARVIASLTRRALTESNTQGASR